LPAAVAAVAFALLNDSTGLPATMMVGLIVAYGRMMGAAGASAGGGGAAGGSGAGGGDGAACAAALDVRPKMAAQSATVSNPGRIVWAKRMDLLSLNRGV